MAKADLERLIADLKTHSELQAALVGKASFSEIVEVARAHGYDVSPDDLRTHAQSQSPELSDQQLDAISAGSGLAVEETTALRALPDMPGVNPQASAGGSIPLVGRSGIIPLLGKGGIIPLIG
jgi:predicted ribosomally synthesized peptide with nif11-like leader